MSAKILIAGLISIHFIAVSCAKNGDNFLDKQKGAEIVGKMIEQGRTLVHHATKRFMIILPAIFFKLGIAFTLLVLVAIVAVNNGFIGFLILVVGLSSVLARLQETRRPSSAPAYISSPPYYHHAHLLDRSDTIVEKSTEQYPSSSYYKTRPYSGFSQPYGQKLS